MVLIALVIIGIFAAATAVIMLSSASGGDSSESSQAALEQYKAAFKSDLPDAASDFRKEVILSKLPWMNRWLEQFELAPRMRILLYQANLKWSTGGLVLGSLLCYMIAVWLVDLRTGNLPLSLLIGLLPGLGPLGYVFFKRGKRFAAFEKELPDALDLMVNALRAGHSFNAALGLISRESPEPIRSEFRICFDEQNYGLELRAAMDNLTVRVPLQDLRIAVTAILIQKETGGNLAEVLNKTAEIIRERFRLRRQVRTHTAHGRMTGIVITLVPFALLLATSLMNYSMESLLWTTPIGIKLLWVAGFMMLLGGLIIRNIINMDV